MHTTIMKDTSSRRTFLQRASLLPLAAAGVASLGSLTATAREPIKRGGQARIRIALNAYSFSKLLNDHVKGRGDGVSLLDLLDYCAKHEFEALDPTGYFFPGYPKVPADDYVNNLKRRAFESGVGISGTRVRNNFTTADKAVREAGVQHIKEWVEVAARLGAPVIRVFCDTQMRGQSWETVAPGRKREEVEDWITGHLKDCAEVGKKFGVIIGVQNHGDFLKTHVEHLNLCRHVDSEWCAAHRGHGLLQDRRPHDDIAKVAPHSVNWQVKESPFGSGHEVRTDLKRLFRSIRASGYRGYVPLETLSAAGQDYDPFSPNPEVAGQPTARSAAFRPQKCSPTRSAPHTLFLPGLLRHECRAPSACGLGLSIPTSCLKANASRAHWHWVWCGSEGANSW